MSLLSLQCYSNEEGESSLNICDTHTIECAKSLLDEVIADKAIERLDEVILFIQKIEGHSALKDNLLGVAFLSKKDKESVNKAKAFFEKALNEGVNEAAQNLAELYFYLDDYENTLRYLRMVESFEYEFPDYKYINWARLYAQVLYLAQDPEINDKQKALQIFEQIESKDESGTPEYFIGHFALSQNQIEDGLINLKTAADKGNVQAMLLLADHYYIGGIIEKNVDAAEKYYLLAAEEGDGRAFYNLAMIARGREDVDAMKTYLTNSARLGYQKAIDLFNRLQSD